MADYYTKVFASPALEAAGWGAGLGGLTYAAYRPIIDTMYALYRPIYAAAHGGRIDQKFLDEYNRERNSASGRLAWSLGVGALGMGLSIAKNYRPNERFGGLASWDAKVDRSYRMYNRHWNGAMPGSFAKRGSAGGLSWGADIPDMDYSSRVSGLDTCMMFTNDPVMANDDYLRNFSTSVVRGAEMSEGTRNPTLGAIQDSAQAKMESKLSIGGVVGTAAKTVIANQASRLFANAIGGVMGLSDRARDNIVSTGTWGMLLHDIVNIGGD